MIDSQFFSSCPFKELAVKADLCFSRTTNRKSKGQMRIEENLHHNLDFRIKIRLGIRLKYESALNLVHWSLELQTRGGNFYLFTCGLICWCTFLLTLVTKNRFMVHMQNSFSRAHFDTMSVIHMIYNCMFSIQAATQLITVLVNMLKTPPRVRGSNTRHHMSNTIKNHIYCFKQTMINFFTAFELFTANLLELQT